MIKSQLVLKVADRFLHIRNRAVERAVNVVLDEIVTAMARKERVEQRGFGAFYSKEQVALPEIQALVLRSRCPKGAFLFFRASKEMGKRLNPAALLLMSDDAKSRLT